MTKKNTFKQMIDAMIEALQEGITTKPKGIATKKKAIGSWFGHSIATTTKATTTKQASPDTFFGHPLKG